VRKAGGMENGKLKMERERVSADCSQVGAMEVEAD